MEPETIFLIHGLARVVLNVKRHRPRASCAQRALKPSALIGPMDAVVLVMGTLIFLGLHLCLTETDFVDFMQWFSTIMKQQAGSDLEVSCGAKHSLVWETSAGSGWQYFWRFYPVYPDYTSMATCDAQIW